MGRNYSHNSERYCGWNKLSPHRVALNMKYSFDGSNPPTIGIVGAGKLGTALGQLVLEAGYPLHITGSPNQEHLNLILNSVLPGAIVVDFETNAANADILILALPQDAVEDLDISAIQGDIIDATNEWDDTHEPITVDDNFFAQLVEKFPEHRWVRTLNQAAYTDLLADAVEAHHPMRRAMALVGNQDEAVQRIAAFVDAIGYDPVTLDPVHGALLDLGGPIFGERLTREELIAVVAELATV